MKAVQQFMLGSVLKDEKAAKRILAAIKDSGYDGIELCDFMLHPMGLALRAITRTAGMPVGGGGKLDWSSLISEARLCVPAIHFDLDSLERDAELAINEVRSFGADKIAITGMYRFDYGDARAVSELTNRLNKAGRLLESEGIALLYHNHNCELRKVDGSRCAFDIIIDQTDPDLVSFEFDSYWFAEAGTDVKWWMERLGKRMGLWHINDRGYRKKGPVMTPIVKSDSMELGTGNMDLDSLAKIALGNGIEAVILESHRNWIDKDPVKSLQLSAEWLNKRF